MPEPLTRKASACECVAMLVGGDWLTFHHVACSLYEGER